MLIQDVGQVFSATISADGNTNVFDLPVPSLSSASAPLVTLGDTLISGSATPPYYFDYKNGILVFYSAPPAGSMTVQGLGYDFFTDDEVAQAVTDSFAFHVQDQDPLPIIDPVGGQIGIPLSEEYLVSLLSAIELLWFRSTDSSQEVDIHTPEGVSIPRAQRYGQITEQIAKLKTEYNQIAAALGVGLYRIQVLNLRRVSYTTNRLVPIFREQEYNQPYSGFVPTTGVPGDIITIYGRYFTGVSQVTFGGVPATTISVISDTEMQVTVPEGGMTGQIGITTPGGVVLSTAEFVVGQPAPFILYGPELVDPPIPPGL